MDQKIKKKLEEIVKLIMLRNLVRKIFTIVKLSFVKMINLRKNY